MSNVAIMGAEFRVFKAVAAHLGVLVVDGVNEDEDDRDDHYCDSHESSYEGQVVHCNKINQTDHSLMFKYVKK